MSVLRSLGFALVLGTVTPLLAVGCAGEQDSVGDVTDDNTASKGRFELFVGQDGQHYFQLLAGQGEKVLKSEGYVSKAGAKNGIESVIENGKTESRYDILEAQNGEYYFNLVARNGEIIGTSETYVSKSNATKARKSVMKLLTSATTADLVPADSQFEVFKGSDGQSYFRLRAHNGEIVLQSEGYSSRSAADAGIEAVQSAGANASGYEILEAANGQHYFHVTATNGEIVGRGEMYTTKSAAQRGADTVRGLINESIGGAATDDEIRAEIEAAADGAFYVSEADYGFTWVHAELDASSTEEITSELVRSMMATYVDEDPDTDKPMAGLYVMDGSWGDWAQDAESCAAEEDEWYREVCNEQAVLDAALAANLSDIKVYYYGSYGSDGAVDGVAVSIFIVGRTPSGNLAGVRTIAIWT